MRTFILLVFSVFMLLPQATHATHIVGGELNYKYLGNNVYEINLTVYRDCYNGVPPFDDPASIGIFNALTNLLIREKLFSFIDLDTVPPTINSPCFIPPTNICYERTVYTDTVILPPSSNGYILAYQRCCRNQTILNIVSPDVTGATYETWIPGTGTFSQNSNPVFNLWPPPFICAGIPFVFDHSASDFEGDSIRYELITPLDGGTVQVPMPQPPLGPPYADVTFQPPYSQNDFLGGTPPLSIDPGTGLLTCFPATIGQFVIGIRAKEFRAGVLVGYTRRDFQLNVVPCPTLVVAALQNPLISCGSNTVLFQNFSFNAGAYHWDFGLTGQSNDTSNLYSPVFTYPDTGVYTVTLIAYSSLDPSCTDTTTGFVTVLPDFLPDYTYSLDTCTNTVSFTDTSNSVSGSTAIRNWRFGDGSSSTIKNPVHQYISAGNYVAVLIATSDRGCVDTVSKTLNIPPLLNLQTQQNTAARCYAECNGQVQVQASSGLAPYTYSWNDPLNQQTALADSLCAGTYVVTVTDSRGCTTSDTIEVTAPDSLTMNLLSTPDYCGEICGGTATCLPSGGNGNYTFLWDDQQNQSVATATGLCQGLYTVTLSDALGCTRSDSIYVNYVDSFPSLTVTADTTVLYISQSTGLYAITPAGPFTYLWTPDLSLNSNTTQNPIATPIENTTYFVIATDKNGCTVLDSITILVKTILCDEPEIFIPSAFSPNGDQQNDLFRIRGNTIETMYLVIYDRWGEKVFETKDINTGWNGYYKGKLVPPDVYVYYVETTCFNKTEFRKKGNVTVIR